jgi:hypothetical protein
MRKAIVLLLLTIWGCVDGVRRQNCNQAVKEHVFIECIKSLGSNTQHDGPVSACLAAAEQVACAEAKEKQP